MYTNIIAHRGASYLASRENTIEAFSLAIDIKSDYIELDVHQTLDKVIVVFHDSTVNGVPLSAITYEQLNNSAKALGYEIPRIEDVLTLCQGKIKLLIEIKEAGFEQKLIALVNQYFSYEDYCMQSFLDIVVRRVKRIDSNIKMGLLLGQKDVGFNIRFNEFFPERRINECHADFVSVNYNFVTPDFVFRMRKRKLPVFVWTVDEIPVMSYLLKLNVDGIITNKPDVGTYVRSKKMAKEER